ncbi:hypothetical protein HDU98_005130, partial [Podochytrium sp. JEL0797]
QPHPFPFHKIQHLKNQHSKIHLLNNLSILLLAVLGSSLVNAAPVDFPTSTSDVAKRDPWCYGGWRYMCLSYLKRDTVGTVGEASVIASEIFVPTPTKRDPWCYGGWRY